MIRLFRFIYFSLQIRLIFFREESGGKIGRVWRDGGKMREMESGILEGWTEEWRNGERIEGMKERREEGGGKRGRWREN